MSESQVISFEVKNLREALRSFDAVVAGAGKTVKAQDGLSRAGERARSSAVTQTRRAAQEHRSRERAVQSENNALRRSAIAAEKQSGSLLSGVGKAANLRARNEPKTPQTLVQRLMGVAASSRFSLGGEGGKVMPLVGKTLGALFGGGEGALGGILGGEAAGGPIGLFAAGVTLVVAAAAKAAEQLEKVAEASAQASQEFQGLRFGTGASTGETARLSVLGSALGLSKGEVAGLAGSVQSNITGNGYGMATGLRAGVFNLAGPNGNTDTGGQLLKVFQFLRSETGTQQIRDARTLGVESALPGIANLSNKQFSFIGQDAAAQGKVFNPRFAQQSADFQASLGRVSDSVQTLLASLTPAIMDKMTAFFDDLATGINNVAGFISSHESTLYEFVDYIEAIIEAIGGDYAGAIRHIENITSGKDDQLVRALDNNTSATQANTQGVGQPGVYGNITRNTGLPAFGYGAAIRMNSDAQAYRLGIYG